MFSISWFITSKYKNMRTLLLLILASGAFFAFRIIQQKGGCFVSGGLTDLGERKMTTGNSEIDMAAQQEVDRLRNMMGVSAQFYFMEEKGSPNAYATSEVTNDKRPDGTVIFGLKLHNRELPKSNGGTTIPMIMAHEFGHIVAYKHHLNFGGKYDELWADYCAGSYMFYRQFWKQTDFNASLKSFFDIGDYQFNSPYHHGTPNERYSSVVRGFMDSNMFNQQQKRMSLQDLIDGGTSYINSLKKEQADSNNGK
jgi:hypothetical protein